MSNEIILNLTPDTKILIALTHTHIQPIDALCELIDNAIDSFSSAKIQGVPVKNPVITLDLPTLSQYEKGKDVIRIADNGPGLTQESAENALRAGYSGNNQFDSLGLFGMGFNISTGKLGSVTRVFSARSESQDAIDVIIDLQEINQNKDYNIRANIVDKAQFSHGTIIEISKIWPAGNDNRDFAKKLLSYPLKSLRDEFGRRYATILREKDIKIIVNSVECVAFEHCVWGDNRYVERKKHGKIYAVSRFNEVIHTQIRCLKCGASLDVSQKTCPHCGSHEYRTLEERISGWVGIQRYDDMNHFGIDLIRNGRAIRIFEKSAFFEYNDDFQIIKDYPIDSNYGRIVGEVHLDHVPVDFMKQDFQRSSAEWHRAMTYLRGDSSLQPLQPNADKNTSPIYKLYQGYRKVKTPGKTDMYMGRWNPITEVPDRIHRDVEAEYKKRFDNREEGYFDDAEWWKLVEEAEHKPITPMVFCPVCNSQNLADAEVCVSCGEILKGKKCINCGEQIPFSAQACPKCGASQEPKILKPWVCNICNTRNDAALQICSKCGAPIGEENHLSIDYLLKHSVIDNELSIPQCTVTLADNSESSPICVETYETDCSIQSNVSTKSLPILAYNKDLASIVIFVDKSHKLYKNYGIKIEILVANEIAKFINLLNKSIMSCDHTHDIPYLSWKIIDSYWGERLSNVVDLNSAISTLFEIISTRLILSKQDLTEYYDWLSETDQLYLANSLISVGEFTKLEEYKQDGTYLKYVPKSFIISLFSQKPELFFDGNVWDETYSQLGFSADVLRSTQNRIKTFYLNCLNDLLYYLTYNPQDKYLNQKIRLDLEFLTKKVSD